MINQKDISTWNTEDILNWLKSINMNQYISKFESNKINGYDLIYLTKEDLKSLGIVSIHDKNIILNSMKDAILKQLRLTVSFKEKYATVQLDFDPNYTVEQLTNSFKLIFKPVSQIFLVVNNNEILMPNLKIIDLILYNPKVYKNFKIISDTQILNTNYPNSNNGFYTINTNTNNTSNTNDIKMNNKNSNQINENIAQRRTPNKKLYGSYYQYNMNENYIMDSMDNTDNMDNLDNNNANSAVKYNKNDDIDNTDTKNRKYSSSFPTLENTGKIFNKTSIDKKSKQKYLYNNNTTNTNNTNTIQYTNEDTLMNKYKTYMDYNSNNDINMNIGVNKNTIDNFKMKNYNKLDDNKKAINKYQSIENNKNIFDYSRERDINPGVNATEEQQQSKMAKAYKTLPEYRKSYTLENGELNIGVEDKMKNAFNNINYNTLKKEENNINQKYPSEKRNFRVNEIKKNYENDISSLGGGRDNNMVNKYEYNYSLNNGLINRNNFDINPLFGQKEKNIDKMNNTVGYNDFIQLNNNTSLNMKYNSLSKK